MNKSNQEAKSKDHSGKKKEEEEEEKNQETSKKNPQITEDDFSLGAGFCLSTPPANKCTKIFIFLIKCQTEIDTVEARMEILLNLKDSLHWNLCPLCYSSINILNLLRLWYHDHHDVILCRVLCTACILCNVTKVPLQVAMSQLVSVCWNDLQLPLLCNFLWFLLVAACLPPSKKLFSSSSQKGSMAAPIKKKKNISTQVS